MHPHIVLVAMETESTKKLHRISEIPNSSHNVSQRLYTDVEAGRRVVRYIRNHSIYRLHYPTSSEYYRPCSALVCIITL